jgi:hypothetical protein
MNLRLIGGRGTVVPDGAEGPGADVATVVIAGLGDGWARTETFRSSWLSWASMCAWRWTASWPAEATLGFGRPEDLARYPTPTATSAATSTPATHVLLETLIPRRR